MGAGGLGSGLLGRRRGVFVLVLVVVAVGWSAGLVGRFVVVGVGGRRRFRGRGWSRGGLGLVS